MYILYMLVLNSNKNPVNNAENNSSGDNCGYSSYLGLTKRITPSMKMVLLVREFFLELFY